MKKIDNFTNLYPLSKTLRFKLIPVGKTLENFRLKNLLDEDKQRAQNYLKVKKIIDRYHRDYIESVLSVYQVDSECLNKYISLYNFNNKDDKMKKEMIKVEDDLRKQIAKALVNDNRYNKLGKSDMIKEVLPEYLTDESELELVNEFRDFTTYFTGFFENRKNMYSEQPESTAIAYRCINDNLPKFIDNVNSFNKKNFSEFLKDEIAELNENFDGIYGTKAEDMFTFDYFSLVLSQNGINIYNNIIGGYTNSNGEKIKGLNEYINQYNQQVANGDKSKRLPQLKQLYKQILSEGSTISFVADKFDDEEEVLKAINHYYSHDDGANKQSFEKTTNDITSIFEDIDSYDLNGIFVKNALELTTVCTGAFKYWGCVEDMWNAEYDANSKSKNKDDEKYLEKRKQSYKKIDSFSIANIQQYADLIENKSEQYKTVADWLKSEINEKINVALDEYDKLFSLLNAPYQNEKKLYENDETIVLIKNALDSVKNLEKTLKLILGTGKESEKDEYFYGRFLPLYERICEIDKLYDRVRNYMTQKPFETDKIKLNFENPQFLGGWDRNKEPDYSSVILRKNGNYYLAIMDKRNKRIFENIPEINGESYEKMVYKLLPGPNKMLPKVFFSKKGIEAFNPPKDILEKYKNETHKTGPKFNIKDCHDLIDFFKMSINSHPDWKNFNFDFSDTESYKNIAEFYNEVKNQGYKVSFCDVPVKYINQCVDEGKLYLFQIYNKDFSENSKGTPNLHTLYFKMLFDERNLNNVVYKLNGESEMFYRPASLKKNITHPQNQPIKNKNPNNPRKESCFGFDLIKNKRYTEDQFMLHIPITMNFTSNGGNRINLLVKQALKNSNDNYAIGIDRGERNLLYISVINSKSEIVEQYSLNEIINKHNGVEYITDYHDLLSQKEKEREDARKNWTSIENIKELKEGYISQVVHKICELVEKYDAVIVMEDLNSGFKNSRVKVEKSVYQKFEKMLIDKLNYYANKSKNPDEIGGILNAYQLTNSFESFKKMGKQNGFIFYVPAWLTSKIDPTTGFVNLFDTRYESVAKTKDFISAFDSISFNELENHFEFSFNYDNFKRGSTDFKKNWTVCTNGERIHTFRNKNKNSEWDNRSVVLTDEFKSLFESKNIDIYSDIKAQVANINDASFFRSFMMLLSLTLQMRNSITGNVDVDYLISPVKNSEGEFYNSNDYKNMMKASLPKDADGNGAYNIARKGLWAIEQIKKCENDDELEKVKLAIKNAEWLEFAQNK